MRIAGISALVGFSLLAACTTGDSPTNTNTLGIQCSAELTVSGSFTASQPRPDDNADGCWPIGTWTFTAQLVDGMNSCSPAPTPLPQYQFEGTLSPDPNDPEGPQLQTFTFTTDPTVNNTVKVTEGGSGSCSGDLELYSADGKQVWVLRPEVDTIDATSTISGDGEFRIYDTDQWN
jgi:hypothetical protein